MKGILKVLKKIAKVIPFIINIIEALVVDNAKKALKRTK